MRASRLSEMAYSHLKAMLLDGRAVGGAWLPIDEIAAEVQASRQPVLDAIKRLSLEGFVEIIPQVGCRVRRPDLQEIDDFFRLFAAGEALTAELAALRATPSDVLGLKLISAQIGELIKQGQKDEELGERYRVLNRRLHAELRRIANSKMMTDVVESLGDRSDFYVAVSSRSTFGMNIRQAHREHEQLIAAIGKGDADAARQAMESHIFATEKRVFENSADDEAAAPAEAPRRSRSRRSATA